ncbi:MAG TPA: HAD family phosphatase [Candidatus Binatia bacterium]|jgi:HAD superfamily hydrolase (TIGR01509 family)
MLKAVIFDFNGVLVDDEPIHFELFRKVLAEEGLTLTKEMYLERYMGMDDRGCFRAVFEDNGRQLSDAQVPHLIRRKAAYYRDTIAERIVIFPGVKRLVPELAARFPLAVASGALRAEIEMILQVAGLKDCFQVIASAEDVDHGKPHPEVFIKALRGLNEKQREPIRASECLVIEDTKDGLAAAHRAGIKCLAVTNSYPAAELEAEAVVDSLEEVTIPSLEAIFK